MINLRYFYRLTKTFLLRFKFIIFVSFIFGLIIFILIKYLSPIFFNSQTDKIGITGRYRTDELPYSILSLLSDGLTKITEDGMVETSLASSWETTDKGKTWIFNLKDDIYWQDKKKIKSSDILYEFTDVVTEIPDNKTIIFKLADSFSPFPTVVSKPTFKKGLLGTGKWKVDKITINGVYVQELTIKNNQDLNQKGNRIRKNIIYKFYPTEDITKLAFKLGEINRIENSISSKPFNNWNTVNISSNINKNQIAVIFFNTQDKYISDKKLRQALVYSIDKNFFDGVRCISPISADSWSYNPQVKPYDFDLERAKEIISELPDDTKNNLNIKFVTTPSLLTVAENISEQWKNIKINSIVQVSSVIPSDFQAFLTILDIPIDPDQYSLWHSTQENTNISGYKNPRIDKLLEDGRKTLTIEERKKIYIDFQRFLVEDSPAAFLYYPNLYTIERK
ncbi:hypothetical protein A2Z22_04495 [Candidatus Woesebacteria bacterium RBG_16_34_12]|uniref:Solute-binding protein family 5 domain-containing protein n=1 Tax=Candidatus Woesebacteria bacterium RBG_16_34_12 TaxID=1802480 RepID=A0A1F7XBJ0_9BACT|nr:MAG: hypothetical protein A2Z22_04495 [Candidatus Woesebacteria bacterium RBG_16_34_12]